MQPNKILEKDWKIVGYTCWEWARGHKTVTCINKVMRIFKSKSNFARCYGQRSASKFKGWALRFLNLNHFGTKILFFIPTENE